MRSKSHEREGNYQISLEDFKQWEEENGKIPDGAIVLILTGKGEVYRDPKEYYGYESEDQLLAKDLSTLHYPGMNRLP